MARSFTALACLALARACSPEDCSACSETQCDATEGCRDESPGYYEARYCRPCTGACGHMDASLGCSAEDNLAASVSLGLMGGFMACLLPFCCLNNLATRRWTEDFLEEGNPAVLRAQATVQEKLKEFDCVAEEDFTFSLRLQFQAKGVSVCGRVTVLPEFWVQVQLGILPLEVAYLVQEPREFVVVENERMRLPTLRSYRHWFLICFLGLVFLQGAFFADLGVHGTGCPVSFGCFAVMLLVGTVCGQFLWLPFRRHVARSRVQVEGNQEQC